MSKNRVETTYQQLIDDKDRNAEKVERTNKKLWSDNMDKSDKTAAKEDKRMKHSKMPHTTGSKTTLASNDESKKVEIRVLPAVKALPKMTMWSHTNQSILVADATELNNLPYLLETDEKFIKTLLRSYGGKKHGDNDANIMDDEIFVKLVEELAGHSKSNIVDANSNVTNYTSQGNDQPFPSLNIFNDIVHCFPDMGSSDVLKKRYIQLTGRVDPSCTPNIDGPEARSLSREQVLESFQKFCRRCKMYNCFMHPKAEPSVTREHLHRREQLVKTPSIDRCDDKCYLLSLEMALGDSGTEESECEWTNAEMSLLRVIYVIHLKDYCSIAKILMTKTCKQVYNFMQKETANLPFVEQPNTQGSVKRVTLRPNKIKIQNFNNKKTYTPCNHFGPCDEKCSCVQTQNWCEKFCFCSSDCGYRFPGCKCKAKCKTKKCECYIAARECDPDLCGSCGAQSLDVSTINCKNVSIQHKLHKHLLLGVSDVAGWGIFLKDACEKGEFISEYHGEIISHKEADRRQLVYIKNECSYLFDLNEDYAIDSTRIGNKFRFANHSVNANCYPEVKKVNGDHRIGIYAKRAIEAGEELFFDYTPFGSNSTLFFPGISDKK